MKRISIPERPDYMQRLAALGRSDHRTPYDTNNGWNEAACYVFTHEQIDLIKSSTAALYQIVLSAVDNVISQKRYAELNIAPEAIPLIEKSWKRQDESFYTRFDLGFDGVNPPKLFECNGDAAASVLECSLLQENWLNEVMPEKKQFTLPYQHLVESFQKLAIDGPLHITGFNNPESIDCLANFHKIATDAGLEANITPIDKIESNGEALRDSNHIMIRNLFKFFDWEEVLVPMQLYKPLEAASIRVIEPAWKMVAANKGLLRILWEMYPGHPNLLYTSLGLREDIPVIKKPFAGRVGECISIFQNGMLTAATDLQDSFYEHKHYVYQEYFKLPRFDGRSTVIGSWIVGGQACGMGIREDLSPIINYNTSYFVPHYFD